MPNYVPGRGNPSAKLMIIGEAPGKDEDEARMPFVGKTGEMVTEYCELAGFQRAECWLTNVSKYRPPNNEFKKLHEIGIKLDEQIANLWKEIYEIRPHCILALGNEAMKAVTGKTGVKNWRGSILHSTDGGIKVVSTYHPASLLHQQGSELPDYRQHIIIRLDFERAYSQSKFKEFNLPQRHLQVVRDSQALYDFFRRRRSDKMATDIETTKAVPFCIGLAFSKSDAISVPILDLQTPINPRGIPPRQMAEIWQMIAEAFVTYDIIGHNFKFDETKLNHFGFIIKKVISDTMLKSHTVNPEFPQALEFLTSIYTLEPYYKNERKDYNPHKDDVKDLLIYNARDAAITYEVDEELEGELIEHGTHDFFYNFVMKLHRAYIEIEQEGVLVDHDYRAILDIYYTEQANALQLQLENLTGQIGINVNSPDQISELLYNKMGFPRRKDVSADTLVALMVNVAKQPYKVQVIEDILKKRKVNKTKSTYINAKPDFDGRMRTQYRITGTETGRTSTSTLEAPIRPCNMGVAFQTMTKHGLVGNDLRRMYIPDPGYIFLEVDASQAEDRPVALMANDDQAFEFWAQGRDRHRFTAALILDKKEDKVTKEDRFIGKKIRHAGNYDMRKNRCMEVINTEAQKYNMDVRISEWRAGVLLEKFHANSPKIRGVYHKAIQDALRESRVFVTPFGRRREFFGRWSEELFKEVYAYIPQSTVSDQVKKALVGVKERLQGIRIIMESHDSFTQLIRPNELTEVTRVISEEMTTPIDFSKCTIKRGTIVIPCEFQIGEKNWKDLVDYKPEVRCELARPLH